MLNGLGVLAAVVSRKPELPAAAGRFLNMSQSGVSRAIARLEARLGVRLKLGAKQTRTVTLSEEKGAGSMNRSFRSLQGLEEAAASGWQLL